VRRKRVTDDARAVVSAAHVSRRAGDGAARAVTGCACSGCARARTHLLEEGRALLHAHALALGDRFVGQHEL
jgi:hypothetical protein